MAQLVESMSDVVLGGVVEVVGFNLHRGKIFTAYISSVDLLYLCIYNCIEVWVSSNYMLYSHDVHNINSTKQTVG